MHGQYNLSLAATALLPLMGDRAVRELRVLCQQRRRVV